jgi:ankyrin repeat protein
VLIKDGLEKEANSLLDIKDLPVESGKIVTQTENYKKLYKDAAIFEAVKENNLDAVKCIVYEGYDVKTKDKNGNTALHIAAEYKRLEIYVWLAGRDKSAVDIKNSNGVKASTLANKICDDTVSVPWMIENQIEDMNNEGNTLLHVAVQNATINTVKCILKHTNAQPLYQDRNEFSAIHFAAKRGDIEIMKLVFINNSTVNNRDREGNTPLHYAAKGGYLKIATLLVENGAEYLGKAVNYNGNTPIQLAVTEGNDVAYYLLKVATTKNESLKHVDLSVTSNNIDISDLSAQDLEGNTALHLAAKAGNIELVKRFVKLAQADVFVKNNEGYTPLDLANQNNKKEVQDWLSEYMEQFQEYKE